MKNLIWIFLLVIMYCAKISTALASSIHSTQQVAEEKPINVIFENNSTTKGFKKFKLTIEDPSGKKTVEEFSLSDDSRRKTIAIQIGSKVYVENTQKLNTLVGGKTPDKSEPLMTVMSRDKNQSIHLVEEENTSQAAVEVNAQKSADKLKLDADATKETIVNGNTVTIRYTNAVGKLLAEFDCDKKNGNVKNINDLRKKGENKTVEEKPKSNVDKAKSLFSK
jgi:hypothetical protein